MPDAHKNLAKSTVATAPSPADSGTSLIVATGEGTLFPAVPFNATIFPAGEEPTVSNAEIVRVTNISTDTLTITRAQEGTVARSVIVTDRIIATVTAKSFTDIETDIANHIADTSDAHDASAISFDPTGLDVISGTEVQTALEELDAAALTPIDTASHNITIDGEAGTFEIDHNSASIDHGSILSGLTDDDHTQYALLAGRATAQDFFFGTASGETGGSLSSTAHATKGSYALTAAGDILVDEANVALVIGTSSLGTNAQRALIDLTETYSSSVSLRSGVLISGTPTMATGIGTTNAYAILNIAAGFNNTASMSGGSLNGIFMSPTWTIDTALQQVVGISAAPIITGTVAPGTILGLSFVPSLPSSTVLTYATTIGAKAGITTANANVTVTSAIGFEPSITQFFGAGTIGTARGFYIAAADLGGDTLNVGLDIEAFTSATTNIGIRNASSTAFTSTAHAALGASFTITPSATFLALTTSGSASRTSSGTAISDGIDGQILILMNCEAGGSTDTITITDNSNTQLESGTSIVLGRGDVCGFIYSSSIGDWIELFRRETINA